MPVKDSIITVVRMSALCSINCFVVFCRGFSVSSGYTLSILIFRHNRSTYLNYSCYILPQILWTQFFLDVLIHHFVYNCSNATMPFDVSSPRLLLEIDMCCLCWFWHLVSTLSRAATLNLFLEWGSQKPFSLFYLWWQIMSSLKHNKLRTYI